MVKELSSIAAAGTAKVAEVQAKGTCHTNCLI